MPNLLRHPLLRRYRYDPLDRQSGSSTTSQPDLQRFYCNERMITQIQGSQSISLMHHDDQSVAQTRQQDGEVDTALLATDQQRSILRALDASQLTVLAYTAYGYRPYADDLPGFIGDRPDAITGHYHSGNGYRQYNPVLMRFNCPDSWSPFGEGGINAYAYCVGDPVNKEDRNGHMPLKLPTFLKPQKAALPPLPPRGVPKVPSLPPPRPTAKRLVFPPENFKIWESGWASIPLPHSKTHIYQAKLPLNQDSIIYLRKQGVHIHNQLLDAPATGSHVNQAFEPDQPQVRTTTPKKTMHDVRKQ